MGITKWTESEDEWLEKNIGKCGSFEELKILYDNEFDIERTISSLQHRCCRKGLKFNTCNPFSEIQDQWILDNFNKYDTYPILSQVFNKVFGENRTPSSIKQHCRAIGIRKIETPIQYSDEEENWLMNNFHKYNNYKELKNEYYKIFHVTRTITSLRCHCSKKGLKFGKYISYSKEELKWLYDNYEKITTYAKLTEQFNTKFNANRTQTSIFQVCNKILNLSRNIRFYTEEEKQWLIDNVNNYLNKELCEIFNKKFGQNVTPDVLSSYLNGVLHVRRDNANSLRKDLLPIGSEFIDSYGYTYVKVRDCRSEDYEKYNNNYETKQRLIWKEKYGEIPDNCQIIFLDSNRTNFDIENLYCIPKKFLIYMRRNKWFSTNPEVTLTAIKWCELMYATKEE